MIMDRLNSPPCIALINVPAVQVSLRSSFYVNATDAFQAFRLNVTMLFVDL